MDHYFGSGWWEGVGGWDNNAVKLETNNGWWVRIFNFGGFKGIARGRRFAPVVVVVDVLVAVPSMAIGEASDRDDAALWWLLPVDDAVSLLGESEYRSLRPPQLLPSFQDEMDADSSSSSSKSSNGSGVGSRLESSLGDDARWDSDVV